MFIKPEQVIPTESHILLDGYVQLIQLRLDVDRKHEQELIVLAQHGNEQAFTDLYRYHAEKIYRYIYYRVGSPTTAEDLTADVFVRMVESLPGYQDRDVPLLAWLYRIAHARVIDHYRRVQSRGCEDAIDEIEVRTDDDLDLMLMSDHRAEVVRVAMQHLTPEQQQVITLRFIEGHSLEMAADLLGKTVGAIKSLQHRALQALSRVLHRHDTVLAHELLLD
jgi:RNA polymerase sigma-70 factor, ECF subfamily